MADAFNKTGTRKLSKETEDKLKQNIKVPDNCRSFKVPKVNPEIWQNLKTRPRVADLKLQQIQAGLSISLTVLASLSDKIAKAAASKLVPKEVASDLLKAGLDGANLIGHQMQEITSRRRQEIKPYLNPDYAGICSAQLPPSEFLFGDNLTETLKSSKAASTVIRNTTLPQNRMMPYNLNQRPSNSNYQRPSYLNYQRPFTPFRGRTNGQRQRGNFNHQQPYRHQYSTQRQPAPATFRRYQ